MHGELQASPDLGTRFARACPVHKRILDGLECPTGHHVEEWATYDRQKGIFLHAGVDADEPEVVELAPRPAGRPFDRPHLKERHTMTETTAVVKTRTVESTRFVDPQRKEVLFVQLIYKVYWKRALGDHTESAYILTTQDEAEARKKYEATATAAAKDGWREEAAGRAVTFRPLPKPGTPPVIGESPFTSKGKAKGKKTGR